MVGTLCKLLDVFQHGTALSTKARAGNERMKLPCACKAGNPLTVEVT